MADCLQLPTLNGKNDKKLDFNIGSDESYSGELHV
jgi:hypothetical protein